MAGTCAIPAVLTLAAVAPGQWQEPQPAPQWALEALAALPPRSLALVSSSALQYDFTRSEGAATLVRYEAIVAASPEGASRMAAAIAAYVARGHVEWLPAYEWAAASAVRHVDPRTGRLRGADPATALRTLARLTRSIGIEGLPGRAHVVAGIADADWAAMDGEQLWSALGIVTLGVELDRSQQAAGLGLYRAAMVRLASLPPSNPFVLRGIADASRVLAWQHDGKPLLAPRPVRRAALPFRSVVGPFGRWVNALPPGGTRVERAYKVEVVPLMSSAKRTWRWTSENPGEGWTQRDFGDSAWWASGTDLHDDLDESAREFWLRATMTLDDDVVLEDPWLAVRFSGRYDVWLNGAFVKSVAHDSAGETVGFWLPAAARNSLHEGANVVALRCSITRSGAAVVAQRANLMCDVGLVDWRRR